MVEMCDLRREEAGYSLSSTCKIENWICSQLSHMREWEAPQQEGHTCGHRNAFEDLSEKLIDCGCEVDGLIDSDRTCLHLYSHHEEIQAVSWLLEHGASVHARIADGRTPLHLAAERNNSTAVVELLVGYGANIDAKDTLGKKPIDYARSNNKVRIVEFLSNR